MLSEAQISFLLIDCKIVTVSVLWLAIMQTIKWITGDEKKKQEFIVDD